MTMCMTLFLFCPFDGRRYHSEEMVCPVCGEPRFSLSARIARNQTKEDQKETKKALWKQRPGIEDNWVDETFLDSLITNANVKQYHYWALCKNTVSITQHFSVISVWGCVWNLLNTARLSASGLIAIDLSLLLIGWLLCFRSMSSIWEDIRSAANVFGTLYVVSPILQTLTRSYSTDTVFTLTIILLLVHLAVNDYMFVQVPATGLRSSPTSQVPVNSQVSASGRSAIALNAAMFSSVILASQLTSSSEVFAFIFFGIETFALSPILRKSICINFPKVYATFLTPIMCVLTTWFLSYEAQGTISIPMLLTALFHPPVRAVTVPLYVCVVLFVTFVGPLWLVRSQKYKNEIQGPWDIAHVRAYS
eukprot:Platyproteum_vivax@DN4516_c0_g1_i1.p1